MNEKQQEFFAGLFMKILCGVCTVLLSIAVNSLDSMKTEIKALSTNVYELSSHTKVLGSTISNIERRLDKLEAESDRVKEKLAEK